MYAAALLPLLAILASATPVKRWSYEKYYDLQAHRGGRGETIENTLPSFAQGLLNGVTTLELDCGITKDGHAVVWHDENIDPTKCKDTGAVFDNDPMFPYVGKYIANLTLAQVQSLDCGSLRLDGFPLQEIVPKTRLATLPELFDFVKCATDEPVLITHQSFDWRALIKSKEVYPELRTSALCADSTLYKGGGNLTSHQRGPSGMVAGIDVDSFPGDTVCERVVRAAHSFGADYISPTETAAASAAGALDPSMDGWISFVSKEMVDTAHELGMGVKPWTANRKNTFDYLIDLGVDGVITDFPHEFRRHLEHLGGYDLAPLADPSRVAKCLAKHNQLTS
ncbi:uncharacterized protein IL334_001526 [Kwoniella shivajii]|uniref:GP-PDE domain-containing protein n=1 Tax=Kwoniella shivajii TaxID=564305 RepID=A0ABZ1CSD0_9TREE|nr:hypothetical protein IL334_001526 [Kwoniella shivajii]